MTWSFIVVKMATNTGDSVQDEQREYCKIRGILRYATKIKVDMKV